MLETLPLPKTAAAGLVVGSGWWSGTVDLSWAFGGPRGLGTIARSLGSQQESDGIGGVSAPASTSPLGPAGPLSGHSVPIAVRPASREGNLRLGDYSPTRILI